MIDYIDPRKAFGDALLEEGKRDANIVALSADSSDGSGLKSFRETFPDRHVEFGIMEQGVIGFAAGIATTGKIPIVATIAPFVSARPFEMMKIDLGYMRQNVKVIGRCAGITYSDLGPTHHSLEDLGILRTIPGMTILNPADAEEITKALHAAVVHQGPVYMRIGNQKLPTLLKGFPFELGKGVLVEDGGDVTIVGTGTVFHKAFFAAEQLRKEGISVRLVNMHTVKPLDCRLILESARKTGALVTVEEHFLYCGLGSAIAELCSQEYPVRIKMLGVDDTVASNGPYEELLGLYGLQTEQIVSSVKEFLSRVKQS